MDKSDWELTPEEEEKISKEITELKAKVGNNAAAHLEDVERSHQVVEGLAARRLEDFPNGTLATQNNIRYAMIDHAALHAGDDKMLRDLISRWR
jgi:hypothetical protein